MITTVASARSMRRRVWSTNSSIEPSRIGSGRATTAPPASQIACNDVTSARDVGPMTATCDPGSTPRAWSTAAMARASSWSWRHGTRSGRSPGDADPTKVTVPPPSAAASRRAGTEVTAGSTRAPPKGYRTRVTALGSGLASRESGEGGRMTPATVVLVNGMGGSPAMWSRVIPLLDELGVPNVAVQLPSGLPESATDDAACVRSLLDESVDPVVLVGHSMGGMVVTEVGSHPQREASRVSGRAHARGRRRDVRRGGGRIPGRVSSRACKTQDDGFAWDTDAFAAYFVGRGWSATDAQEFVLGCRPQRAAASVLENTQAAWRSVPSTFVSCDDSEMSAELRALFGSRATDVIEMPGDHFPIWLRPDEVAQILARIAGEAVDE